MLHDLPDAVTPPHSPRATLSLPSLSQRGQNLLSAIRGDDQDEWTEAVPAALLPMAFLVLADETIDAELAGLSLAKQLAGPPTASDSQSRKIETGDLSGPIAGHVALLMLDPLGATLRLAGAMTKPAAPARLAPQQRAASRADWSTLLSRLPRSTRLLLVLDTTGEQHNLVDCGPQHTMVILARTGADGRVAGYRKLKELAQDSEGQPGRIGFFFVEGSDRSEAASGEPRAEARGSTASCDTPASFHSRFDQARETFTRLAETAERFLNRPISFFGSTAQPAAEGIGLDLLGQRPSLDRQENRHELTRWLASHTLPWSCVEPAAESSGLLTDEELAELHSSESAERENSDRGEQAVGPLPAMDDAELESPEESEEKSASDMAEAMCATGSLPASAARADQPAVAHDAGSSIAPHSRPLPVVAIENWPISSSAWSDLVSTNPRLIGAESALTFRPPVDPATVLLVRAASGSKDSPASSADSLIVARFAAGSDLLQAAAGLSASVQWAHQNWLLLRRAFPDARLAESAVMETILLGDDFSAAAIELFRTGSQS